MKIIRVKITKIPNFILITEFEDGIQYHYYMVTKLICARGTDLGCWNIKYKKNKG